MRQTLIPLQIVIAALLAACSGGALPAVAPHQAVSAVHGITAPGSATRGIYVGLAASTGPAI